MKKINITILLTVLMSMVGVKVFAYQAKIDGIYYNFSGEEAIVTNYSSVSNNNSTAYSGDVSIPKSVLYNNKTYKVTSIGQYAFDNCYNLTSIAIPNSVTSIGRSAFSGCSSLTSVTIPNSVTSIGDGAFFGCSGLTSAIIPNSVTRISEYTFYGCSSFTSITIPKSVTSIGEQAFASCTGLTYVVIPNSVTNISKNSFHSCTNLNEIYNEATTPITLSSDPGFNYSTATLHVPTGKKSLYQKSTYWKNFVSIEEWEYQEQSLNLAELPSFTYGDAPYTLPAKTEEGLELIWTVANTKIAELNGNTLTITGCGTTTVTATQAGNYKYLPFSKEYTLTVEKATQTITWEQEFINVKQFDQIELTATASSGLDITYQVEGTSPCSVTKIGNKTYLECNGTGDAIISAYQAGNDNYWNTLKKYKSFKIQSITGVEGISDSDNVKTLKSNYSIDGKSVSKPQKGINIQKMSDGTSRKIVVD